MALIVERSESESDMNGWTSKGKLDSFKGQEVDASRHVLHFNQWDARILWQTTCRQDAISNFNWVK